MGMGRSVANEGAAKVTVIHADVDVAIAAAEDVARGAEAGGATVSKVPAQIGAPDYAAVAASALANDPEGIAIAHVPNDIPRIIQALRQAGFEGPISTLISGLNQQGIEAIGDAAEGVFVLDRIQPAFRTDIPAIADYAAGMEQYAPDAAVDGSSLNAWLSVTFFEELVKRIDGPVTAEAVLNAVTNLDSPIDFGGIVPEYSGPSDTPPVPEFPQVVTFQANLLEVEDGQYVDAGGFFDPLAPA
jgi:ABC-type branched-subunit amino acid transport system substrate-binding protein